MIQFYSIALSGIETYDKIELSYSKDDNAWFLSGVKTYHLATYHVALKEDVSIRYTIAVSDNKEELIVWADMNNIKIEKN